MNCAESLSGPLTGKRIVITRRVEAGDTLRPALQALGADVFELPTIRIEPPKDLMEFGQLVQDAHCYDWIVFTSATGVNAFFEMFYKLYDDAREIGGARIATIGPGTTRRVKDYHLKVDLEAAEHIAEGVVKDLQKQGSIENERILVVRGEMGRNVIARDLNTLGAIVDEAIAYRTLPETEDVAGGIARFKMSGADMIVFTSSSTAENFMALKLPLPPELKTASLGRITSKTLRQLGIKVDVESTPGDIPALVDSILKFFTKKV